MIIDEYFMQRCIELAQNGLGNTYPNPLVGSVLVYNNKIIAEGFHTQAGKPHAEVEAINSLKEKSLLSKCTLYVNLEPCSHFGKTPPCAQKIVELKIPRVVVGTIDTTEKVSGKGIEIMQNAGIDVKVGVLEQQCRNLNKRFFTYHEKKRPYIVLKWAQSKDGFMDIERNSDTPQKTFYITSKTEQILVHKWRTQEQAILVGTNTILNDNPRLNARLFFGNNPIRLTFDFENKLNNTYNVFDNTTPTIVFNYKTTGNFSQNLKFVQINKKSETFGQIFDYLYSNNIQSILIEGGQKVLNYLLNNNIWDEALIFVANKKIQKGLKAPNIKLDEAQNIQIGNSKLYKLSNQI